MTLDALFHGGHHVMRNTRCAVQNQRITLRCCTVQNLGPQSTLDTITKTDLYKVQSRSFEPCRHYCRLSLLNLVTLDSNSLAPHINVSLREHPDFPALVLKLETRAEKTGCSRRLINVGVVFFTLFLTARSVLKSVLHVESCL